MTWADFYLVCFVVGFFLSMLMFLAGGMHLHIPHFHGHALPVHRVPIKRANRPQRNRPDMFHLPPDPLAPLATHPINLADTSIAPTRPFL